MKAAKRLERQLSSTQAHVVFWKAKSLRLMEELKRTEAERAYWADLAQVRQIELDWRPLGRSGPPDFVNRVIPEPDCE